jgi:hypothetical protein
MNRNSKNIPDNLNNTTILNITDEGTTIPVIDSKKEFEALYKIKELIKNPQPVNLEKMGSSYSNSHILEAVEKLKTERLAALKSIKYLENPADEDDILN